MRKSKQVILTAVLLSAITSIKASGQKLMAPDNKTHETPTTDSTSRGKIGRESGHGGDYVPYGDSRIENSPAAAHTTRPRTGGFGNTLRTFFSGHS